MVTEYMSTFIEYKRTSIIEKNCYLNFMYFSIILLLYVFDLFGLSLFDGIKFVFIIWYFNNIYFAYKNYGFLSVYTIFLLLNAFFIYDAILLDLLNYDGLDNFLVITFPVRYVFDDSIGKDFILYSSAYIFVLDVAFSFFTKNFFIKNTRSYFDKKDNEFANNIGFILLLMIFPISLYRALKIFSYIWANGYITVLLTGIPETVIPQWTNGTMGITYVLFLILIIHPINKKQSIISSILIGIVFFVKGLSGGRGQFLYQLFSLIIIYESFWGSKKIEMKKIFIIGILCLIFSIFVGQTREQSGKTKEMNFSNNSLFVFFASQTNSRGVPLTVIQGDIPFHEGPFIFSRLQHSYSKSEKDSRFKQISETNDIDLLTSYKISKSRTSAGNGLGGAVIAEFIDCGGFFGVILWSIILAALICILDSFENLNYFLRPLFYTYLVNLIHSPRGYFFDDIGQLEYVIVALVLYFILVLINRTFFKTKYLIK